MDALLSRAALQGPFVYMLLTLKDGVRTSQEERRNLVSPAVSDKLKSRIRQLESEIASERDERLKMERSLEKTEAEVGGLFVIKYSDYRPNWIGMISVFP